MMTLTYYDDSDETHVYAYSYNSLVKYENVFFCFKYTLVVCVRKKIFFYLTLYSLYLYVSSSLAIF